MMTEPELDSVYTHLCQSMTRLGEQQAPLFMARLALLAFNRLGDAAVARALIDTAERGLGASPGAADPNPGSPAKEGKRT